eukprot:13126949-Ditylum_brightwellii.AAC.1
MAHSSAEAEIYATDECVKELLRLCIIWMDLNILPIYMPKQKPITVFNDNMACVYWPKATTTKGLRHITICESAIREAMHDNIVSVEHIAGNVNLADIFTKEHKEVSNFFAICDQIATSPFAPNNVPII